MKFIINFLCLFSYIGQKYENHNETQILVTHLPHVPQTTLQLRPNKNNECNIVMSILMRIKKYFYDYKNNIYY